MKSNNILRVELIKKWVRARRGRMGMLAKALGEGKNNLYATIFEDRMSAQLLAQVEQKKNEIEALERECIREFPYFIRFVRKGQGRMGKLAKKLGVSSSVIRDLAHAKKDGKYRLIDIGTQKIKSAIRDIESERRDKSYSYEHVDVSAFLSEEVKKKSYTLQEVMALADQLKQMADTGNQDGAVICRRVGDKYKILSIGFDKQFSDPCKSHICDKNNPHIHAVFLACLNVPKKERDQVGTLVGYSQSAPCPNCAPRLIGLNIDAFYCLLEPELMGGLNALGEVGIPVYKYNLATKTIRTINSVVKSIS